MSTTHPWRFFRAGGFDQVRIDTAADLLNLKELDQKLWVALSCPTQSIEFDAQTLTLLDTDNDGHIRAPELLAALDWAAARLSDTSVLAQSLDGVPLAAISDEAIAATARSLLPAGELVITVALASNAKGEYAARALADWEAAGSSESGGAHIKPLGDATEAACLALAAVKEKIDDFFARCHLVTFDERAAGAVNASDETLKALGTTTLNNDHAEIAALPLAKIGIGQTAVPLHEGINPAWATRMAAFRTSVVTPLLGTRDRLSEIEWLTVQEKLAAFSSWQTTKPDALSPQGDAQATLDDLERLARYVRDLLPLANNLVAFRDFYTRQGKANFQIGTLYLDGRAADLCIAVTDAGKHGALATLSRICLVYCECVRGEATQTIAAAITDGDSDQLMVGRNGVFYDRQGRDWKATVTKIIDHPISLRQAFWSPYKKLVRMIAEQFHKFAANKASAVENKLAETTTAVAKKLDTPPAKPGIPITAPTAPVPPFDVGKFAGIFAAIGLAVGAIGTAAASVVTGLLGLKFWQIPLALVGLMLLVSGPSMAMAWFKLRSRNLGPLLDANGWAVNARARINIPFGTSLTHLAKLPEGAESTLTDPYAEKQTSWKPFAVVTVLLILAFAWYVR